MDFEGPKKKEFFGKVADFDISPMEYYELVSNLNMLLQYELSEQLRKNADTLGNAVTFVTPGSDARLEKGSFMSPLEVIALTDTDLDLDVYEKTLSEAIGKVSSTPLAKVIEMKGPSSSLVQAYGRYQPGRIADARLVYGSEDVVKGAKVKLGKEIIGLNADQVDKIAALKRQARKSIESGGNRIAGVEAMHFDLNTGAVFYNPSAYQLSFKIGPLRLVQNSLLIEEVKHTRKSNDPSFMSTLDSSIVKRLQQLSDDRMLSIDKTTVDEVAEHYAFFLRLYHRSERAYSQKNEIVMQLTPAEIAEVSKRLQALNLIMERFHIQKKPI